MYKKFSLTFSNEWVLSRKDDDVLPIDAFVSLIKECFEVEVLSSSLTDCDIIIKGEALDDESISSKIIKIVKEKFNIDDFYSIAHYAISDYTVVKEETECQPTEKSKSAKEEKVGDHIDALTKINELVGAEEFKALANECVAVAPGLIRHNTVEAFTNQCYLFSINDGNGFSTYLELFAELLDNLNLFKSSEKKRVVEELLPPPTKETNNAVFNSVTRHFQNYGKTTGSIISIDIREWMSHITKRPFREFLNEIFDHMGEHIIVFRVPFVEKEIIGKLKKELSDVLFIRDVSFVPFDNFELTEHAQKSLSKFGFTMEAEAWDVFNARISEEKGDGRFYGINTVNKVIREMIYKKHLDNALNDVDDTVIKKAEILSLSSTYSGNEKSGMDMLDDFIGMEAIKAKVEEIVAQIEMTLKNENLGHPCFHMRFIGNPGTGKTTVARVIGKILKEKGILRNGNFFEYSGRDFCGVYVGETAPKTAGICRDAYGSVLFIDEAYSLFRNEGVSTADYGREAVDTLIAEMENHRKDLVVIMAGYPNEMETLMKANAGLESRMPYVIEFPNYTREQLIEIFMLMVNNNFTYKEGFYEAVEEYFKSLPDEVILSKDFSNARFVRNLFERTWGKAVLRSQLSKDDATVLIKEDFILASSEKEFKKIMIKQSRALGFV